MADSIDTVAAVALPAEQPAPEFAAPAKESFFKEHESAILGAGFFFLVLFLWQMIPVVFDLSKAAKLFFTTPIQIVIAMWDLFVGGEQLPALGGVWPHFYSSATAFCLGLGFSIIVALPLGVLLGRSTMADAMLDPFVTAFNATPRLVFLPIVLIWFGVGTVSVVVIVFIGAVFPLLINTYEGVKNADKLLINVVRSFGASEWEINKLVVLPNSLPFIVAGLRLAIGRAILGVVVAEFFGGAETGLGKMMVQAAQNYQVDILFAGLITFMLISLIMTGAVKRIETRLSRWRPQKVKAF